MRRYKRGTEILLAAWFAVAACSGAPEDTPSAAADSPAGRPNILLILADDLGYTDLGAYGGRGIATPNLDRLAREGMRFTSFYANGPTCAPTRVALLTGRYPQRFGLYGELTVESSWGLPSDVQTLPRLLREGGYETIQIGKWHVGHAEETFWPEGQGFDRFFGFLHAHHLPKTYLNPRLRHENGPEDMRPGHLTDLLTDEAAQLLRSRQGTDAPFFLNLWYFAPHKPLQPPAEWAERYDDTAEGLFAAQVSSLDASIGRLLAVLEETGLAQDTLVLFLSDNGGVRHLHGGRNGTFRGGKAELLEGGIRVPLIVRWPNRVPADTVSDALAASFDLLPTLADLAGVDIGDAAIDGRSLAGALAGREDDFDGPLFWLDVRKGNRQTAVRRERWKLRSEGDRRLLHDLWIDPGEAVDLAAERSDVVDELDAALSDWETRLPPPT